MFFGIKFYFKFEEEMVLGIFGFKDFDYVVGRYFLVLRFIGS